MLVDNPAFRAAARRAASTLFRTRLAAIAAGVLIMAGCTQTAPPSPGKDPADPAARVAPVGYRSTLGAYIRQRPVEPAPWRERNERVAPPDKP